MGYPLLLFAVSEPIVIVAIPRDPLYAGTIVVLNCIIVLDDAVNNTVMVDVTWSAPDGGEISNSTYIMASATTLRFTPLALNNSGIYTCQATANPGHGSEFITTSLPGSGVGNVTVQGKSEYYPYV